MFNLQWLTLLVVIHFSPLATASPPVIANPSQPPTVETWHLREAWRLDNEADEELPLMGVISQGVVAADGQVLLPDTQMTQVLEILPGPCLWSPRQAVASKPSRRHYYG